MTTNTVAKLETFERIARENLGLLTLKTRNSDAADFHELAVWKIAEALDAAYQAGRRAERKSEQALGALIDEYREWNTAQGLALGSADEHVNDETLTAEQRAWLVEFCARWDAVQS